MDQKKRLKNLEEQIEHAEEILEEAVEPVVVDMSSGTAEDVEAVMKKYDRESNVRIWEGTPRLLIRLLAIAFSVYCIWVALFSTAMPEIKLNLFLGFILILGYLNYPIKKGMTRVNHMPWYDILIMAAGAFTMGASIELSADAPIREPFAVWMQGGITYTSGKLGVMLAAQQMIDEGLISL